MTPYAALEIFIILLIPLTLAAVHMYRIGVSAMVSYEAKQLKTMMVRSAETGTELIHMEGRRTAEEGRYLDLAEAMEKIDAIDFGPISDQNDGENGREKSTIALEQAKLQFWYLVVRGDGRTLLVDSTAGTSRELTEDEDLFVKCSEAAAGSGAVQWEHEGAYFSLFLEPIDGPLTFEGSPLLYNVADGSIGMFVKGDLSFVEDSVRGRVLMYVLILYGLLLIILAVMCMSVHRSLRVLRDMRGMMQRYRLEQKPIKEELKRLKAIVRKQGGDNELKNLAESFYAMAGNLQDYQDTVDSIRNKYEPFVPEAVLSKLCRKNPLDIRPGDTAEITGDLLELRFEPSCESTDSNRLLAEACELIMSKGGMVVCIAESGLKAIFPLTGSGAADTSGSESAAEEAAELIQNLRRDNTVAETIRTELRHGTYRLQVIGSAKRMTIRLDEKEGL